MIKGIPLKVFRDNDTTLRVTISESSPLVIRAEDEDEANVIEDYWTAIVEHSDMLSEIIDFDLSASYYDPED